MINHRLFEARSEYVQLHFSRDCNNCGDQLLVNSLYITNLYKQDAVSVTRLQCICGILDFELSIIAFKSI